MKLFTAALFSLAALHQLADAWTITPSQVVTSSSSSHDGISKTWTVSGSEPLTSLQLKGIGRIFVSHDSSLRGDVAKVVFSGSDASLLDVFDVASDKHGEIQVRLKNTAFEGQGYLVTHVYVANKQSIENIAILGSNDAIVGDDVIAESNPSATIELSVRGSGDLYAGSGKSSWSVANVVASVAGSGDLQLQAKSLDVKDSLLLSLTGSGDIGVFADNARVSNKLQSNLASSGDIHVQSSNLEVNELTTSVAGSGDVTYANKGSCQHQEVSVAGSGDVMAGSIMCVDTKVTLVGSGDVLVQTTGNLVVSSLSSGDVKYYGTTPRHIETADNSYYRRKQKKIIKQASRNRYNERHAEPLPTFNPVYVALKMQSSYFSDGPLIRYEFETDHYDKEIIANFIANQPGHYGSLDLQVQSLAAQTIRHVPGFVTLAFVGGALVIVGVVAKKYHARREREKYQPLV